jgi:hypothetical protein
MRTSCCLRVCASLPIVVRQRLGKHVSRGNEYTCNNKGIIEHCVFYAIRHHVKCSVCSERKVGD